MTFADVVQGDLARAAARSKLVLVGATASGLGSTFSTPLSSNGVPMGVAVCPPAQRAQSWHRVA
ncbi:MAG: CHASE2 domain-containing protein [Geminicoccaceae bacterium]